MTDGGPPDNTYHQTYTTVAEVPAGDMSALQTLADTWEATVGFSITFTPEELVEAANNGVSDIQSLASWASRSGLISAGTNAAYPWASWGMTSNQYIQTTAEYSQAWQTLTGQPINGSTVSYFADPLSKGLTSSEASQQWQNNAQLQQVFPWLKYDMNYTQFQAQKQTMTQAFGYQLSDAQAAQQLEYFHTNAGTNQAANVEPTFTQIEKKSADVGTPGPGTVVR